MCLTNWPLELDGEPVDECPECGEETSPMQQAPPIDEGEALSRLRHAQFERWLRENGRE